MKYTNILFFISLISVSFTMKVKQESNQRIFIRSKLDNQCIGTPNSIEYGDLFHQTCGDPTYRFEWSLVFNDEDGTYFLKKFNPDPPSGNYYAMEKHGGHNTPSQKTKIHANNFKNTYFWMKFYIEATADKRYYIIRSQETGECLQSEKPNELYNIVIVEQCNDEKNLVYFQSPLGTDYFPVGAKAAPKPAPVPVPAPAPASTTSSSNVPANTPAPVNLSYFSFPPRTPAESFQPNFFLGKWYVDGLYCNNQYVSLLIEISEFKAVVIDQNPCYKQGSIFFVDRVVPTVIVNNQNIAVTFYLENNQTSRTWLSVTGKNTFVISKFSLNFYRKLC